MSKIQNPNYSSTSNGKSLAGRIPIVHQDPFQFHFGRQPLLKRDIFVSRALAMPFPPPIDLTLTIRYQ
ncbi:hypothetical protein D3OALGA1CA_5023 [Olavius algarvensis associated proteobacterium Delta 3]|nr:hypothetical protein D3OALGA1CA_5023 [Olavius algarvensis associated proteobacterium Delta 3]